MDVRSFAKEQIKRGQAHHRAGRLKDARSCYRLILSKDPNHADALNGLGLIAHQVGQNETAIRLMERAVREAPQNPSFHCNLSSVLGAAGRLDAAADALQTAQLRHLGTANFTTI